MLRPRALLVLRVCALLSLAVSAALLVDYLRATPSFCAAGSGCDVIKHDYGFVGGVLPIPVIGVVAFAGLFGISLARGGRRVASLAAVAGGFSALGFLLTQAFVIKTFCVLCVITDTSAVVAAVAGLALLRSTEPTVDPVPFPTWVALGLLAVGVPPTFSMTRPAPPVPRQVAALWKANAVNVIEESDFECPFCRMAHPALKAALAKATKPVNLVRKTMPLPMHPHARDASRAWICAVQQGKGEPMADALFETKDLSKDGCEKLAKDLGLDVVQFQSCVVDRKTDALIDKDVEFVRSTEFKGLPTIFIGSEKLLGAREEPDYDAAVADAEKGETKGRGTWWPLVGVLLVAAGVFSLGMKSREEPAPSA